MYRIVKIQTGYFSIYYLNMVPVRSLKNFVLTNPTSRSEKNIKYSDPDNSSTSIGLHSFFCEEYDLCNLSIEDNDPSVNHFVAGDLVFITSSTCLCLI